MDSWLLLSSPRLNSWWLVQVPLGVGIALQSCRQSGVDVAGLSLLALEWWWSFSRAKIIWGGWGLATVAQRPEGRGWQHLKVPNSWGTFRKHGREQMRSRPHFPLCSPSSFCYCFYFWGKEAGFRKQTGGQVSEALRVLATLGGFIWVEKSKKKKKKMMWEGVCVQGFFFLPEGNTEGFSTWPLSLWGQSPEWISGATLTHLTPIGGGVIPQDLWVTLSEDRVWAHF